VTDPVVFEIRAATGDDGEWAARLMAASDPWITLGRGLDHCRNACERPECELFMAHALGTRCGFALFNARGVSSSAYLAAIAVAPSWRSRGTGAALLEHCERQAALTSRHFFLCVSSFNMRAQAFYARHGYRQVGQFDDYVIDGASELLMYKRVAGPAAVPGTTPRQSLRE
jgi:[ribosomal protein S18]-alanine N-acetyltransferase